MKDEVDTNINMDNKDHIVLSCDTLGTTVPEALQNLKMSSLTRDNIKCVDEKESDHNHDNCEVYIDSSEHVQSSKYVNYYDSEGYVLEQLKTEFPEDVLPQSDCGVNSKIHSENKELLKFVAKAEIKGENTDDGLSLNIKEENDYNEYQFIEKTEGLEEQEGTQCMFSHKTLKNGCNLLQNRNKHVKVEINTPVDNGITELHQCQYCGKGLDNYNNMLIHISNEHTYWCKKEFRSPIHSRGHEKYTHRRSVQNTNHAKFQCDSCKKLFSYKHILARHIKAVHFDYGRKFECCCGKQFRSPIHLNGHKRVMHQRNVENSNNSKFQCDYCKIFYKTKSNLLLHIQRVHYDYGKRFDCWCGKQFRSPIHLGDHQRLRHRPKISKTNNERFQCDSCKNFFKTRYTLVKHIKSIHYDYGKRFDCWCGKQFRSPIHLREHERHMHRQNVQNTNNGKFQCDSCKIFFQARSNLVLHIKRLHYDYGKRFDCWCGKQFRSPIQLRAHKKYVHR